MATDLTANPSGDFLPRAICCLRRRSPLTCAGRQLIETIADIDLARVACSTPSVADQRLLDMCAIVTLASHGVLLRPWRSEDREPFAQMNCDARVMEFFRSPLDRRESDALVDRIQQHWEDHGFGLWALELSGTAPFIGFCGLSKVRFTAHFTPCVEVGWRLAAAHWGHGYATESAKFAIAHGFSDLALPEVVSFTSLGNLRSRAVMERLGMHHDPADDFDHPSMPHGHPLARHALYRLSNTQTY